MPNIILIIIIGVSVFLFSQLIIILIDKVNIHKSEQIKILREQQNLMGFSKEQKAAIIGSLAIIANANSNPHPNEAQYINAIANQIDIDLDDSIFNSIANGGRAAVMRILWTLYFKQKEWYIIAVNGMIKSSGIYDTKIYYVLQICDDIGISKERYNATVEKSAAVMQNVFGYNDTNHTTSQVSSKLTSEMVALGFKLHLESCFPDLTDNVNIRIEGNHNENIVFSFKNGFDDDYARFIYNGIRLKEVVNNCKLAGVKKLVFIDEIKSQFTDITITELEKMELY